MSNIDQFIVSLDSYIISDTEILNSIATESLKTLTIKLHDIIIAFRHLIRQAILKLKGIKEKISIDKKLMQYSETLSKKFKDVSGSNMSREKIFDEITVIKNSKEWEELFTKQDFVPSNNKVSVDPSQFTNMLLGIDRQIQNLEKLLIRCNEEDQYRLLKVKVELYQLWYKSVAVVFNKKYNKNINVTDLGGSFTVQPDI